MGDQDSHRHATMCKIDSWWEAAMYHRKLSLVLCDDLGGLGCGWDGGSRGKERYIHI